jgi:nitrate reductase gamma subunit
MSGITLLAIAYVSLLLSVVVAGIRTFKMARRPVHLRWELAPVMHEKGKSHYGGSYFEEYEWWTRSRETSLISEAIYMFQEIVFLKGVWENNRRLWWFSFPFHFGLYLLIVVAAMLLLAAILGLLGVSTASWTGLGGVVMILAAAGYVLGAVGATGLLLSRLFDPRLKPFRTTSSLFNLAFLVALFLTGGIALLVFGDFSERITVVLQALLTADGSIDVPVGLAAHLVLVFLFCAYLPCTQMFHFVAKYFTYHRVRWDDEAMVPKSELERRVLELLQQPVTWSAPHLQADGKKNWVDIATQEVKE